MNDRPHTDTADWNRYAVSRPANELGELSDHEKAKKLHVERMAVFGVDYRLDPNTGEPIPNSRPIEGDPNHLFWVRKQELDKQSSLKELLASVRA